MNYNAGQLATIIKMACKMDVIDIGEDSQQDSYIFEWMNMFMFQNAKKIRKTATSSTLTIAGTGYFDFLINGQPINDMYEPYQMLDANDKAVAKRTSYDATTKGWYREDSYSKIHIRDITGDYRLKYIKYPTKITLDSQFPELPPAAYHEMITWVCAQIKLVKNYYQESQAVLAMSNSVSLAAVKAAQSGMGTNAQSPGPDDAKLS